MNNIKKRYLTKTILLLSFISLMTDVASEMLYPIMPVYLKSIGFSTLLIGILEGIAESTAGLSKGYFGKLSDVTGKRNIFIRLGYSISALSKPLLALSTLPIWVFFVRTLDRLGKGIRTSPRDAMLSDETTKENKGKVFGFHRAMDTLGAAIGPILALLYLLYKPEDYKMLFLIAFFPGLIVIVLTFFIKEKTLKKEKSYDNVSFFSYLSYWKVASSDYKKLIIGLLAFAFFNSSDAFLLLMLKSRGLTDSYVIGAYIFYNIVYALFSLPAGYMGDKIGLALTAKIGLVLFIITYASIGYCYSVTGFAIIFFIYGIYASTTEGVWKALITNLSKKEDTATALGFFNSISSIFTFLSSSIAGAIWFKFGAKTMFLTSAVGVSLVLIYFLLLDVKISKKKI